ncbi:hypothetical protein D3C81_1534050 [compost metagenome]
MPLGMLLVKPVEPLLPPLMLALAIWLLNSALFSIEPQPRVPVLRRFCSASAVLAITLPSSWVCLPTSIW